MLQKQNETIKVAIKMKENTHFSFMPSKSTYL